MTAPYTLFEVSWEICNKVGGIHTVVSTKARTLVSRLGDDYVVVGPWLLHSAAGDGAFEEQAGFDDFCESCRAAGIPVRVGRWRIPGRPRTILVEFSALIARKDEILSALWEDFKVDSLTGEWDYVEPVLFGWAAGQVIEKWWREHDAAARRPAVAQFHEWMTGSGLLHLKSKAPAIGTVFTTHATVLGRSTASTGTLPAEGLRGRTPEAAAREHGVVAKNSMEAVCARSADVFTTDSELTADEAELFFGRRPRPILPNGIELSVIDELAGEVGREEAAARVRDLAWRFLGEDPSGAALVCIGGRYEFHNKGIDFLLDTLARLAPAAGRRIVLLVLVPAGNSGLRRELLERLARPPEEATGSIGLSTHNLFDFEKDPLHRRCAQLGLDNRRGARVKVIQVPIYLEPGDGVFDLPYEAVLRAMDLSVFPSFYEPWGYTPQESLALGVPSVTTDLAGFGRWALQRELTPEQGLFVLPRAGVSDEQAQAQLAAHLEEFLAAPREQRETELRCRATAQLTAWSDLIRRYEEAFEMAVAEAARRAPLAPAPAFRPRLPMPVVPSPQGHRPRLIPFRVAATLPPGLLGLERLARNLWWSWDAQATELFRELSPERWEACGHNPIVFLREERPDNLRAFAADADYVARLSAVLERFDVYMQGVGRTLALSGGGTLSAQAPVAYFCAEFGLHESLRIYSGGLGALAGDHLKSASDIGLPLVGIGLFYRVGYLRQRLTPAGEQLAVEAVNDPQDLPLELVRDAQGVPLEIELPLPSSRLLLQAWRCQVGRVPLYLLDSDLPVNRPEDRAITRQLYGGDHEHRLKQEIVLGRGGKRLVSRLGLLPPVYHINEGHAAFLVFERVSRHVRELGQTFEEAREFVRATTVFTTHTPVPAGHDRFDEDLMRRYFSDAPSWAGLPWERFFALGACEDDPRSFNMTYLAMSFASAVNGVSELHGAESRKLLHPFWPRLLEDEVPVTSVTNGIHLPTWTDPELATLLGAGGRPVTAQDFSQGTARLDDATLWGLRQHGKRRLLECLSERLEAGFIERGDSPSLLRRMQDGLDPEALWIGFARRFAPYKRAALLLRDPQRLRALLSDPLRPVRLVFAGKAHPRDHLGQEVLRQVVEASRSEAFLGKLFFVEDYDLELARTLVRGVDVWLNTPVRPLEASGTSGMKAAANGALNLSILDGWWCEAWDADRPNGWSIGQGRVQPTQQLQDEFDGEMLQRLLREEIQPLFFEREQGLPAGWLQRVRRSLETIPPVFNTDRMVGEYRDRFYLPLAAQWFALRADRFARNRELSARSAALRRGFEELRIREVSMADLKDLRDGEQVGVRVRVELGELQPRDVAVEMVLGHAGEARRLLNPTVVLLEHTGREAGGVHTFEGAHVLGTSGSFAYGIRVRVPGTWEHDLSTRDLVLWA